MTKIASLPAELDEFDLKLLDALQENNQRTSEELADLVHLSPASCLRRARRLREIKAIVADVSIVAPEVIGPRMTMIVLVSFEREQYDVVTAFKASMRAHPQVTQCYYVTELLSSFCSFQFVTLPTMKRSHNASSSRTAT